MSVLIETMRREGYELQVGQPQVIFKEIDGVKCEPIEELKPIAFDPVNNTYLAMGDKVGDAFGSGKALK